MAEPVSAPDNPAVAEADPELSELLGIDDAALDSGGPDGKPAKPAEPASTETAAKDNPTGKPEASELTQEEIDAAADIGEDGMPAEPDKPEIPSDWTPEERKKFQPAMEKVSIKAKERGAKEREVELNQKFQEWGQANDIPFLLSIRQDQEAMKVLVGLRKGELVAIPKDKLPKEIPDAEFEEAAGDPAKLRALFEKFGSTVETRVKSALEIRQQQEAEAAEVAGVNRMMEEEVEEVKEDKILGPLATPKNIEFGKRVVAASKGQMTITDVLDMLYGRIYRKRASKAAPAPAPAIAETTTTRATKPSSDVDKIASEWIESM